MTAAAELLALAQTQLWVGFVVFLRVAAITALLPGFGEQTVPMRVKLVIALAFTLIVAPAIPTPPPSYALGTIALLILSETATGALLGLGLRLFVLALQTAGAIAAQSTSLSQILGGAGLEPLPAMGHILTVSAVALAVMTGLHVKAAQFLVHSYVLFPVGLFSDGRDVADWGRAQVARAFQLAFVLSAPFVLVSVLYNLALGVINKAMPQLMVAFVGAPVITLGGLFVLFLAAPTMLHVWVNALDGYLLDPTGITP
ncbi:MAG: flagellar biosynthetic protein FliR [Pseudomonadota bacterium]